MLLPEAPAIMLVGIPRDSNEGIALWAIGLAIALIATRLPPGKKGVLGCLIGIVPGIALFCMIFVFVV
jgi:hypothetical protein